jgi:uncharacterized protein (TIRG00374 family)
MLLPVKSIPTWSLFSATAIGFMANNLLPARLGEIVRAYVLGRHEKISISAAFATIVYERIVDVFSLIVCLWVTLSKVPGPDWLRTSALWLMILNVVLFIVMFAMERYQPLVKRVAAWVARPLPEHWRVKLLRWTDAFLEGLAVMSKTHTLVPIALASLPVWIFAMLGIYYSFLALEMQVPLFASLTLVVLVAMGSMIPSAPAYLGTTQYACIVGLSFYGVAKSEALAFSLLYHATQFFPITLVGFYFLWKSEVKFGEISRGKRPPVGTSDA